jgi:hypothetical protein
LHVAGQVNACPHCFQTPLWGHIFIIDISTEIVGAGRSLAAADRHGERWIVKNEDVTPWTILLVPFVREGYDRETL